MTGMQRRSRSSTFAAWAAVAALVLKAAVPLMAATAAELRGVAVAEICPIYGVEMPAAAAAPMTAGSADPHAHHHHVAVASTADAAAAAGMATAMAGHAHSGTDVPHEHHSHGVDNHGEHCALGAIAAFAAGSSDSLLEPAQRAEPGRVQVASTSPARDGAALWAARLGHGPPRFS